MATIVRCEMGMITKTCKIFLMKVGLPTFCFAIPGHLNTKNSKIDATEAYETR